MNDALETRPATPGRRPDSARVRRVERARTRTRSHTAVQPASARIAYSQPPASTFVYSFAWLVPPSGRGLAAAFSKLRVPRFAQISVYHWPTSSPPSQVSHLLGTHYNSISRFTVYSVITPCLQKNRTQKISQHLASTARLLMIFGERGSLFNYLLTMGEKFDIGRESSAQFP